MPRLLLIQPPIQDFYETEMRLQPIGLAYLKAAVRTKLPHWEVRILDFHRGWGRRTVALPSELEYLAEYYPWADKSPFSTFHQYFHFGASFDEIARQVAEARPDLVGISCLFSPYYREALQTARAVKAAMDVPVIVGGSHVSALPESILASPEVDFVIRAEGEKALVEFLRQWEGPLPVWEKVPNLGFKRNGVMIFNSVEDNYPIEEIPIPDLGDFSPGFYEFYGKPLAFLVTSRSCPHRCSFCSVHATFGFSYRRNPVSRVLEEIELRYAQGYRVLDFEDDNLSFYQTEMKELCRGIIHRFPKQELQLLAMNGISYLSLDDGLLVLMRKAGFTHLNIALVSSDTTVRETTKRPHTLEKYLEVVETAHRLGFQIISYQILGLPQESLESMIQTLALSARLPVRLGASPFYLTPNSPIARKMGFDHGPSDILKSRLSAMAIETENFKREDLYTLFVATRVVNFLKGLDLEGGLNSRDVLGMAILRHFFTTGEFCAATPEGLRPLPKFNGGLFRKIWERIVTGSRPTSVRALGEREGPQVAGQVERPAAAVGEAQAPPVGGAEAVAGLG